MADDAPSDIVRVERDGPVATIILDRPERRNALNNAMKGEIAAALARCNADPQTRVIVIAGAGDYFAAGTDIAEMIDITPVEHLTIGTDSMFRALRRSEKPLIAAVEGYALGGGCELALCCDMIVAGDSALFGQPEIRVGIMPGAGGTQAFARALGRHRAMMLLLTGDHLPATEAHALGMISQVVKAGEARAEAERLGRRIAAMPPLAVAAIRKLVNEGPDMPIDSALALERHAFMLLFSSQDQKEGMRAFLEKRKPLYLGK